MSSLVDTPLKPVAPVSRTLQWVVWAALGLILVGIGVGFVRQQWQGMEQHAVTPLERYRTVPPFTLTERSGQPFDSTAMLKGRIWLVDFFFTACPGPCLKMNGRMEDIQQALVRDHADVRSVSFSIAPEMDTPEVLRKYAQRFHASPDKWAFLTGSHDTIYNLAEKAFMLPTVDQQGQEHTADQGDFIHSEKIALVDRQGVVRKYFDSTNPEILQQVLTSVGDLLREQPDAVAKEAKGDVTLKTGT